MYYLDAVDNPIVTLTPQVFKNKAETVVQLEDYALPAADRVALGIWPLQSDPVPDPTQFVVTGETYATQPVTGTDKPSVMLRHWQTRPLTTAEQTALHQATLDTAIQAKCDAIDAYLAGLLQAGFVDTTTGKTLKCDDPSIIRWNAVGSSALGAMVLQTNPAPSFELICTDNSRLTLGPTDAFALLNGRAMPWVSRITLNANTHQTNVKALTDPTAIASYDFSGGW